ncbi:hypothetical protein Afil01_18790 [Actinorhabdospora filicis]|uniref:Uncharacterized protein n=1 Tax=Actinorhabdospora filicis TaxID=1785913 RepID=A0A9W6SJQ9_9ACTN|nr:hypothetical protein Afil01_18790 [Actinorhabdospora filicis]
MASGESRPGVGPHAREAALEAHRGAWGGRREVGRAASSRSVTDGRRRQAGKVCPRPKAKARPVAITTGELSAAAGRCPL